MEEDLKTLTKEEIKERLQKFPGWKYANDKLSKEFEFESFPEGVSFVVKLMPFCERIDHHPDIHISYKKIRFELTRFSVGGKVTERDFRVVEEIEKLYS